MSDLFRVIRFRLVPTIVSVLFAEMLSTAFVNTNAGIRIRYKADGASSVFRFWNPTQRCFKPWWTCSAFLGSTAVLSYQLLFCLRLYSMLPKVSGHASASTCGSELSSSMGDATLKNVEIFTYLGSYFSSDASFDR